MRLGHSDSIQHGLVLYPSMNVDVGLNTGLGGGSMTQQQHFGHSLDWGTCCWGTMRANRGAQDTLASATVFTGELDLFGQKSHHN